MKTNSFRNIFIVITSFLIMFIVFATCISCMGIYMKPVTAELGVSRTAFSMTITIGSLAMMLSAVIVGKLIDKISVLFMMIAGILMVSASMIIFSTAASIGYFYLAAAIMGTAVSMTCNIPIAALIRETFEEQNVGFATGIAFAGSGAGAMVLNPFYTHLIENEGWRSSFFVAAVCTVILVIPLLTAMKMKPKANKAEHETAADMPASEEDGIMLSEALRRGATWRVFIAYILVSFVCMGLINNSVPFLTDNGFSAANAARVIAAGSGLLIFGKIIFGKLIDKIGTYKATVLGSVLLIMCVVCFWAGGCMSSVVLLIAFAAAYGLGASVGTVSIPCVVFYMYGKKDFSAINGFFTMTSGLGGMAQVLISVLYDKTGEYSMAWAVVTALCVALSVLMICSIKSQKTAG